MVCWTAIPAVVVLLSLISEIFCDCDRDQGPSGGTECVLLNPLYSEYQYASCLTDSYIRARSGGKHACLDHYAAYCYYQCMLELNNIQYGPVYRNCSCDPNAAVTEQTETLPDWCYSPDGTSCKWYRQCLEKRYPCNSEENSYALDFGEKFCLLYDQHYDRFDKVGKTWINAVRKCLQVSLVDMLRPYQHPTCDEIKARAFDSHSGCYLNPAEGVTSFCDIGFENWFRVLVTVKSSLSHTEVIGEALVTAGECFRSHINRTVSMVVSWKEKQLDKLNNMINDLTNAANDKLADDVFITVLNSDELTDARLKRSTTPQTFQSSIELLMLPRNKYDLNYYGRSNLTTDELIKSFLDHVDAGEITYKALNGIELLQYRECNDTKCENPLRTVTAPPPTPFASMAPSHQVVTNLLGICFITVATVF